MKGKLIVLEGIDGSGKSTQLEMLCRRLERENKPFRRVKFPRYDSPSSAPLRMYLGGGLGDDPDGVNAYAASSFFAVDRYISYKNEWGGYYENGGMVITDRYTTSNAVHQGAKLPGDRAAGYLDWLYDYEFEKLGLPKPDLVIFLDISAEQSAERLRRRTETPADIHEKDGDYLRRCVSAARLASARLGWTALPASETPAELHERIYRLTGGLYD